MTGSFRPIVFLSAADRTRLTRNYDLEALDQIFRLHHASLQILEPKSVAGVRMAILLRASYGSVRIAALNVEGLVGHAIKVTIFGDDT